MIVLVPPLSSRLSLATNLLDLHKTKSLQLHKTSIYSTTLIYYLSVSVASLKLVCMWAEYSIRRKGRAYWKKGEASLQQELKQQFRLSNSH
jgi:hypothetical protein